MSIKDKIKSIWEKVHAKNTTPKKPTNKNADAELAADEVIEREVFPSKTPNPSKPHSKSVRQAAAGAGKQKSASPAAQKPASKRSRTTNNGYHMIDPDGDTCDTGKS